MDKIRAVIKQSGTLSSNIKGTQSINGNIDTNRPSSYYYTKAQIDAFRSEDREYVDGQVHILNIEIDGVAHKIVSVLENKILTTSLLDANDNVISVASTDLSDIGRKQIYNDSNVDDYEHQVDDIWLCETN